MASLIRHYRALSDRFRARRDHQLRAFIKAGALAHPGRPFRILDLGGRFDYWNRVGLGFLEEVSATVTCVNKSQKEARADGKQGRLESIIGDARALDIPDMAYDLVHSNSVVEHVGRFAHMRAFANEVRRLAPAYYMQTPYMWFPVDPHFPRIPMFHWMPLSWRLKLVRRMRVGWSGPTRDVSDAMAIVESSILLDRAQFQYLFPDARIRFERVAGLPKSMIAERR